jgi:hypothetical protein
VYLQGVIMEGFYKRELRENRRMRRKKNFQVFMNWVYIAAAMLIAISVINKQKQPESVVISEYEDLFWTQEEIKPERK